MPASRAGRPRTKSVHPSPHVPVAPTVGRPRSKSVFQPKVKDATKKNPTEKKPEKPNPPLEPNVVIVIDPEDQEFPHPADQPPDLPLVGPEQVPNNNNPH